MSEDGGDITLAEALQFAVDEAEYEDEQFEGDVPKNAIRSLVNASNDLLYATIGVDMAEASEEREDIPDEQVAEEIEEYATSALLAIGAIQHEYEGVDLAEAFEERMELIRDYRALNEAIEAAEGEEEAMEAIEEEMTETLEEELGTTIQQMKMGVGGVQAGMDVSDDDYDGDGDRYVQ